jgi:hypothetical protein
MAPPTEEELLLSRVTGHLAIHTISTEFADVKVLWH